ncbi:MULTISPECIES: nitronate monooxygenase family protein [unclassified Sporosarcina]|uniref:NAD(P)H-dependent flavin oxidoreductase n=1 Tax=unclassified Sporosarcina TaxID=2647733 RepID=UPI00203B316A|nr:MULTISPECIES: nitronate monooxygenase [unclassified Sporosarcina]GKV64985.1 nitronate monooxygenase [Sporosarcina sp. NCCP-2331]GLB56620.1 nitronate monooxygenase [Sporosarcina sp. NCCP-2378]
MQQTLTDLSKYPLVQAPMAGVTTPEFVAACSEAGALGSIGAGYLSAEETRQFIQKVKQLTSKPFQVNFFVPEKTAASEDQIRKAIQALEPIADQLGLHVDKPVFSSTEFKDQIDVIIEEKVQACSFTFGLPQQAIIDRLKQHEICLIGTATTIKEAQQAEQAGMDAVVLQGSEAGGHRGSFSGDLELVPLDLLLDEARKIIQIPIIAAGGIATKEQIDRLQKVGAAAVQIGTVLLTANESGANPHYKEALLQAEEQSTVLTKVFSGKLARGIKNSFINQMENSPIAPYPFQNDLTKPLRSAAAKQGKSEYLSLWAGKNVHLCRRGSVKEIIEELAHTHTAP